MSAEDAQIEAQLGIGTYCNYRHLKQRRELLS
jgi:hypothetical protein